MKPVPPLIALFLFAAGISDLAVARMAWNHGFPHPAVLLVFGLMLGQVGLLAAWLALGRSNLLLRSLVAAAVASLLAIPLAQCLAPSYAEWLGVLLLYSGLIVAPLVLSLLVGMRLSRPCDEDIDEITAGRKRWQFSICQMLTWTTVVALALGILQYAEFPWFSAAIVTAYFGAFAAVAVAALWSILTLRGIFFRALIVFVLCPAVGAALSYLEGMPPWPYAMITAIQAVCVAAAAVVVRLSGYRWRRPPGLSPTIGTGGTTRTSAAFPAPGATAASTACRLRLALPGDEP